MQFMDSIKRFFVVLFTELLLFLLGTCLIYMLYMKNCNIADIVGLMTLIIGGITGVGAGYLGIKTAENLYKKKEDKSNGSNT